MFATILNYIAVIDSSSAFRSVECGERELHSVEHERVTGVRTPAGTSASRLRIRTVRGTIPAVAACSRPVARHGVHVTGRRSAHGGHGVQPGHVYRFSGHQSHGFVAVPRVPHGHGSFEHGQRPGGAVCRPVPAIEVVGHRHTCSEIKWKLLPRHF